MDRLVQKEYEWLLERPRNAYQILEIEQKADSDAIRKAYRQKALVYHPDKNKADNAAELFREIVTSYNILSEEAFKAEYDEYLAKKNNIVSTSRERKANPANNLKNEKIAKFKVDLKKKEDEHKLQAELIKKKKLDDLSNYNPSQERTYNDVKTSIDKKVKDNTIPTLTIVKWKNRKDFEFDEQLVQQLMEVFGPVVSVKLLDNEPSDNYHYANVEFKTPIGAALASTHDYSKSSHEWDGKNMHKISTLLRSVELADGDRIDWDKMDPNGLPSLYFISYCILTD